MEKVIVLAPGRPERRRLGGADARASGRGTAGAGSSGVTVSVRDAEVRNSLMTLTTLDPPVQGFVSLWTQQHFLASRSSRR